MRAGVVYISNTNYSTIPYYSLRDGYKLLGTIGGSPLQYPTGMAVDSGGDLYVATANYDVLVYEGQSAPKRTLSGS